MAIGDFRGLVALLEQHPEWRAELRRLVLTDELVALPELVRELAEAQARTEARLEQLAEAQARTEARLEQLAEAQARTEARLEELAASIERLAAAQARTEAGLQGLTDVVQALGVNQRRFDAQFRGALLEQRYRTRPGAYLRRLIRDPRTLTDEELDRLLRAAEARGQLQEEETADILRADAVVRGLRRDGRELYVVVEVSWGVNTSDVERALRRAQLLARAGVETVPVVAGARITPAALRFAESAHVERVTGGTELEETEPEADGAA